MSRIPALARSTWPAAESFGDDQPSQCTTKETVTGLAVVPAA